MRDAKRTAGEEMAMQSKSFLKKAALWTFIFTVFMILPKDEPLSRCNGSMNFGQPYKYALRSPGAYKIEATFSGEWWAYRSGDPLAGQGNDRGSFLNGRASDWIDYWPQWKAYYLNVNRNDWAMKGVDGCITGLSEKPLMVVSFDDVSKEGDRGYFAVAVVDRTPDIPCEFDFDRVGSDIILAGIPAPEIKDLQEEVREGKVILDLSLAWQPPISAFYKAPEVGLGLGDIVTGYEIYYRHSFFLPRDRDSFGDDPAASWVLAGRSKGCQAWVRAPAPSNRAMNLYLAIRLVYDGETPFRSRYVGSSGNPVNRSSGLIDSFSEVSLKVLGGKRFEIGWKFDGREDVAGFNILRSYSPDGNFKKVNRNPVRRAPSPSESSYLYQDRLKGGIPQNFFFYRIEAVDAAGRKVGISDTVKGILREDL